MRVLKIVAIGIIAFSVLIFGVRAFLSKDFRVERSIQIDAPPVEVFDEVNSLRKWNAWSPWIARDPSIQNTYSGPDEGVGASVSWTSEGSGSRSQTIVLSEPPSRIETQLDFGEMGKELGVAHRVGGVFVVLDARLAVRPVEHDSGRVDSSVDASKLLLAKPDSRRATYAS